MKEVKIALDEKRCNRFFNLVEKVGEEHAGKYLKTVANLLNPGDLKPVGFEYDKDKKVVNLIYAKSGKKMKKSKPVRVAFKKKAQEDNKDYRVQETNPNYTSKGKGEKKWRDYRTSMHTEAALLRRIARLKKRIEMLKEASMKDTKKEEKKTADIMKRLRNIRRKIAALKKKAKFDPRILTDLNPESSFGPAPTKADEKGFRRVDYGVQVADEGKRKQPVPNTQSMVTEVHEVQKAMASKAAKVAQIVDDMIEKGLIKPEEKYKEIERLISMNSVELKKVENFVKKASVGETVLIKDDVYIDFSEIVGD